MLRNAEPADVEALARIYNQAMRPGSNVTARLSEVDSAERRAWLAGFVPPFGVWVYEHTRSSIVGWCSLAPFAVRPRLPNLAEVSLYVDEKFRSGIIAARLLCYVVNEARGREFRSLVSIASDKNVSSLSGSIAYGFRQTATLYEVGRLSGTLANATWLQKDLRQDDPPQYRSMRDSMLTAAGVPRYELTPTGVVAIQPEAG